VSRTARLPRRVLVPAALALIAACLTLTGCAAGKISQTADQVSGVDGASGTVGAITVLNARLAQPTNENGYTQGSNGRLLLWISNDSITADTLSQVSTPAATSVRIAGDATIPGNYLVDLSGVGGTQVIVTGFTQAVPFGQDIPMTFSFATAGSLDLNIPLAIPSDRSGARETAEIQPPQPTAIWDKGTGG
jgi:copper(I)-binding protein